MAGGLQMRRPHKSPISAMERAGRVQVWPRWPPPQRKQAFEEEGVNTCSTKETRPSPSSTEMKTGRGGPLKETR